MTEEKDKNKIFAYIMWLYKVRACPRGGACVYGENCFDSHNKKKDRRAMRFDHRSHQWSYSIDLCTTGRNSLSDCQTGGNNCPYSHSKYEFNYHPLEYKTRPCKDFANGSCRNGILCWKYHEKWEQRRIDTRRYNGSISPHDDEINVKHLVPKEIMDHILQVCKLPSPSNNNNNNDNNNNMGPSSSVSHRSNSKSQQPPPPPPPPQGLQGSSDYSKRPPSQVQAQAPPPPSQVQVQQPSMDIAPPRRKDKDNNNNNNNNNMSSTQREKIIQNVKFELKLLDDPDDLIPKHFEDEYLITDFIMIYRTFKCKKMISNAHHNINFSNTNSLNFELNQTDLCEDPFCLGWHNLSQRRRSPREIQYLQTPCENLYLSNHQKFNNHLLNSYHSKDILQYCSEADNCPFAHNYYEMWFHPQSYRIKKCIYERKHLICDYYDGSPNSCGIFCPFYHYECEQRLKSNPVFIPMNEKEMIIKPNLNERIQMFYHKYEQFFHSQSPSSSLSSSPQPIQPPLQSNSLSQLGAGNGGGSVPIRPLNDHKKSRPEEMNNKPLSSASSLRNNIVSELPPPPLGKNLADAEDTDESSH